MKINVATNFINRVIKITTNKSSDQQKHVIFQHLRQNNYPTALINRLLNRIQNRIETPQPEPPPLQSDEAAGTEIEQHIPSQLTTAPSSQKQYTYRAIPYIPQLSTGINKTFQASYPNVKLASKPIKTTKHLLPPVKDPVPPLQQSQVIYSIPCADCEKCYIGMTRNQLKTRLSGHKSNISKHARLVETNTEAAKLATFGSALIDHMIQHQHNFDVSKTKIIDRSYRTTALPILEMCHITNTPNTVNYRSDVDNLSSTYAGILHTIKNNKQSKRAQQSTVSYTTLMSVYHSPQP
ncbi:uncharacterized protein LOC128745891 [Sabethes cyaneus]|uniref:uncharacterized protein LOC128745891 n=1 Tax=Sabethes cyaneus TaxID=53552 RepID=UPI00237E8F14|nr:uncharacterized protein LOC128745891 [Sabethes cyaneus]